MCTSIVIHPVCIEKGLQLEYFMLCPYFNWKSKSEPQNSFCIIFHFHPVLKKQIHLFLSYFFSTFNINFGTFFSTSRHWSTFFESLRCNTYFEKQIIRRLWHAPKLIRLRALFRFGLRLWIYVFCFLFVFAKSILRYELRITFEYWDWNEMSSCNGSVHISIDWNWF